MSILPFTLEHEEFRERMRDFVRREVTPNADKWEAERHVPREAWKKMGREGFLCPCLPPEYGGMGGDFLHALICIEEMAKSNQAGLMSQLHSDIVVPYIQSYGSQDQKKRYLPGCASGDTITAVAMTEPDAGSDLAAMSCTAKEQDGEVVLNGTKTFISNGINCDLLVLAARDPQVEHPHKAISLYLLEDGTPGFHRGGKLDKLGMHSQDTAELYFSDCRIPLGNRLGDKGAGFAMLMEKLQQERLVCAIWALAMAENVLEYTLGYCRNTHVSGKPLSRSQSVQFALAEMGTDTALTRAFVEKLVLDHMAGKDIVRETSMVKWYSSDMANRVVNRCMDLAGDFAIDEACPLARAWRDLRVMPIFAGTNEIMKSIIAKSMGL
jgi:alkylation response protein AidB-like acyl-CoA dehydrogenase